MIPIYRAKKIDSDEYIEGCLSYGSVGYFIDIDNSCTSTSVKIDPSTLAIHFPNMFDSEGTRIFASLSEDGKGGDILTATFESYRINTNTDKRQLYVEHYDYTTFTESGVCSVRNGNTYGSIADKIKNSSKLKVTGIKS